MSPTTQTLEWVKPPRQARSQQTLERILDAAEILIIEKGIDNLKVAEVAKRAGSSVGSLYSRFGDKESLIRCACQRFYQQALLTIDDVLAPERWAEASAQAVLEAAMAFVVRVFRERGALIAAFTLRATTDEELGHLGHQLGERIAERMLALIRQRGEYVSHPNLEEAVVFAVWLILSALESRAIHASSLAPLLPDELIARELAHLALSYLGIEQH